MRTWNINGGDLTVTTGSFEELSGTDKAVQDLKEWLTNNIGHNRFHLEKGSALDSYVGMIPSQRLLQEIKRSAQDAIESYQREMASHLQERIEAMGNSQVAIGREGPSSIIESFDEVQVFEQQGNVYVFVRFHTLTNEAGTLSLVVA